MKTNFMKSQIVWEATNVTYLTLLKWLLSKNQNNGMQRKFTTNAHTKKPSNRILIIRDQKNSLYYWMYEESGVSGSHPIHEVLKKRSWYVRATPRTPWTGQRNKSYWGVPEVYDPTLFVLCRHHPPPEVRRETDASIRHSRRRMEVSGQRKEGGGLCGVGDGLLEWHTERGMSKRGAGEAVG